MNSLPLFRFAAALVIAASLVSARAETSDLWGTGGERWSPQSRLPDFSHAGYRCGEAPLPDAAPGVSVRDFGAVGDGETDDTAAFLKALETVRVGAIEIPPGRYRLTNILEIRRSGVVLRGAGPDKTVLFFPQPLHAVKPDWSATTTGQRTSNYSWSGGFVWFKGNFGARALADITAEARRGDAVVRVSDTGGLRVGARVEVFQSDTPANSLMTELYGGDPGDTGNIHGRTTASMVCRIVRITGAEVGLDRPLRFNVKAEWKPRIRSFEPTVTESGVENLCFEFPSVPYKGHFTELGFNAVAFSNVSDCWARRLRIVNCDSGVFPGGRFCTIENVTFESTRAVDATGCSGHHGIYLQNDDNRFANFDFRMRFIHDITVSGCAGNVIANGRGVDLCFDHHKRTPYENLFSNIDAGAGRRLWRCGGGAALGRNCGARGTFWNIRAAAAQTYPPQAFGPASMNLVAVRTEQPSETSADGRWFEAIPPEKIVPPDIHAAQLERRLRGK